MSIFVTRLKELQGGNSVSAFARLADTPQPSMDKYLKGRLPSIEILIKIACRFGVSADWLLGLTDERKPGSTAASDAIATSTISSSGGFVVSRWSQSPGSVKSRTAEFSERAARRLNS